MLYIHQAPLLLANIVFARYSAPGDSLRSTTPKKELLQMRAKLNEHLRTGEDRVRIYLICEQCLSKIETVGIPQPNEETVFLI